MRYLFQIQVGARANVMLGSMNRTGGEAFLLHGGILSAEDFFQSPGHGGILGEEGYFQSQVSVWVEVPVARIQLVATTRVPARSAPELPYSRVWATQARPAALQICLCLDSPSMHPELPSYLYVVVGIQQVADPQRLRPRVLRRALRLPLRPLRLSQVPSPSSVPSSSQVTSLTGEPLMAVAASFVDVSCICLWGFCIYSSGQMLCLSADHR